MRIDVLPSTVTEYVHLPYAWYLQGDIPFGHTPATDIAHMSLFTLPFLLPDCWQSPLVGI